MLSTTNICICLIQNISKFLKMKLQTFKNLNVNQHLFFHLQCFSQAVQFAVNTEDGINCLISNVFTIFKLSFNDEIYLVLYSPNKFLFKVNCFLFKQIQIQLTFLLIYY